MIKGIFAFYWEIEDYVEPSYHVIESDDPSLPMYTTVGADAFKLRDATIPSTPTLEEWRNAGRPVIRIGS